MQLSLDHPDLTRQRRQIFGTRPVLKAIYTDWYRRLLSQVPAGDGRILEIGSGGGFLEELCPEVIRSDILPLDHLDVQVHATSGLPFRNASLKAVLALNVFHHLARPRVFLTELTRCLRPGGRLCLIEPWNSLWSRFVYTFFHHEAYRPRTRRWEFASTGPLSGANGALPWIIWERDRARFESEFSNLKIQLVQPLSPFSYALSGGFTHGEFLPGSWFAPLMRAEEANLRLRRACGMFALYVVERV
ncbi:MAG TPA: methyltransferase domain-containing protein [Candidatus Ozemobacteraceae bacterium]|nr:methyltransferase domain-containing protein [Candidatus Ozemobacteraceae bacterium]